MATLEIIEAVKARPELWCSSNFSYKDRVEKDRINRGIAKRLGIPVQLLKKKWKNIKDQYRKELKKKMAIIAENGVWEYHWPYMDHMEFLREEIFPGGVVSSEIIKTENNNGQGATEYDDSQSEVENLLAGVEPGTQEAESEMSHKRPGSDLQGPAGKRFADVGDVRDTEWIDEDYHYCMSLLPTLRSLGKIQKLEFRGKVNEWLLETLKKNEIDQTNSGQQTE